MQLVFDRNFPCLCEQVMCQMFSYYSSLLFERIKSFVFFCVFFLSFRDFIIKKKGIEPITITLQVITTCYCNYHFIPKWDDYMDICKGLFLPFQY